MYRFNERFTSLTAIKVHLMENFGDQVPNTTCIDFSVGFYERRQSKKRWLYCHDDLDTMYSDRNGGELTLWCEGRKNGATTNSIDQPGPHRCKSEVTTRRQEKEEEVDQFFSDLKDKHGGNYSSPKLRLWARMIASGIHESIEEPPDVPAFQHAERKRRKGPESLTGALTGAVEAIAKVMGNAENPQEVAQVTTIRESDTQVSISPGKAAELRMRNLEQLCYLQGLCDDNILSDKELAEQKRIILGALRKLTLTTFKDKV